ncbi:MAG: transketolase-like TK C-terminal-containing protein, partial [Acidimicrobiia bacterium]
ALRRAADVEDAPSMLILRSHIGWPSPTFTDTAEAHGNPLGDDEIRVTKEILGLPPDETFWIPDDVLETYRAAGRRGREEREAWDKRLAGYEGDREAYEACIGQRGLPGWEDALPSWSPGERLATRKASGKVIEAIADKVPGLVGGGADLTGNTGTVVKGHGVMTAEDPGGRQIYFGIREHGMGGTMNGMSAHGGVVPVGGTFFVFSDYMRPAVRLSALMSAPSVWVWTHDSVFLGEDGPTHQPIEHLPSLRAMPNLWMVRPADANETLAAWEIALNRTDGPVGLLLTRQDVPILETDQAGVKKGGYVLREGDDVTLIATGSELHVTVDAANLLDDEGIAARVVSLPCWELFFDQDEQYRSSVLGSAPRVAVEAASPFGWERLVGHDGLILGIDHFGESAPDTVIAEKLGFTGPAIAARVRDHLST